MCNLLVAFADGHVHENAVGGRQFEAIGDNRLRCVCIRKQQLICGEVNTFKIEMFYIKIYCTGNAVRTPVDPIRVRRAAEKKIYGSGIGCGGRQIVDELAEFIVAMDVMVLLAIGGHNADCGD